MSADDFRAALCALRRIDARALVARGLDPALAQRFVNNPTAVFVADDRAAEAAWALIEDAIDQIEEPQP